MMRLLFFCSLVLWGKLGWLCWDIECVPIAGITTLSFHVFWALCRYCSTAGYGGRLCLLREEQSVLQREMFGHVEWKLLDREHLALMHWQTSRKRHLFYLQKGEEFFFWGLLTCRKPPNNDECREGLEVYSDQGETCSK